MKQGKENLEVVKNEDNQTRNYIFQKNKKTKIGAVIIIIFLVIIGIAITVSGFEF